jgi:aspartyl-tRNA(Asn)/glutamyl-tRNA(Gln) amidotransferase subunit C
LITKKDVDHVALLGRLELTGEENDMYTRQLNDILGHFQNLERLDTDNVQPTAHVLPLKNVFREDRVGRHVTREEALANCPDRHENFFKVPRIV